MKRKLTFTVEFGSVDLIFEVSEMSGPVAYVKSNQLKAPFDFQKNTSLEEIDKILKNLTDARE